LIFLEKVNGFKFKRILPEKVSTAISTTQFCRNFGKIAGSVGIALSAVDLIKNINDISKTSNYDKTIECLDKAERHYKSNHGRYCEWLESLTKSGKDKF
jgi:hypothetical protein